MKVIISAYACEPHKGSEPGVGWNWVKQIAKFAEVWVITRANNRGVIEAELKKNPEPNLHFVYYDVPKWFSFWKKKTRGLHFYYSLWQIGIYKIARKIHKQRKFDLVHHLTFGNLWLPTFMFFLKIPFIWGPIGGGEQVPWEFRKNYSIWGKTQEIFRDIILYLLKINPLFLYSCRKADTIIVRTKETFRKLPRRFYRKAIKMIETGTQAINFSEIKRDAKKNNIQILSVGRLIHWKGFDLALKAFAIAFRESNNVRIRMSIVGDGSERKRLMDICQNENISQYIMFTGYLSHEDVLGYMCRSDIFLFPSFKEGGAWVLFEAMLSRLPIICLDVAGAGEIINNECGIKVKPITPEQTINDLAAALLRLIENPDLREKMGAAGQRRVKEYYSWDKKGEFIHQIYQKVLKNEGFVGA